VSDQYIGEIRLFAGGFAPAGWLTCDGQLLSIGSYGDLFDLIGTTYGGDGVNTFALPDLRGRVPVHQGVLGGSTYAIGDRGGAETVTLTPAQLPAHSHGLVVSADPGVTAHPAGQVIGVSPTTHMYGATTAGAALAGGTIDPAGGSQPHENLQPYQCVTYIIAWTGYIPSAS
jgi:microcystin-dependent protein